MSPELLELALSVLVRPPLRVLALTLLLLVVLVSKPPELLLELWELVLELGELVLAPPPALVELLEEVDFVGPQQRMKTDASAHH